MDIIALLFFTLISIGICYGWVTLTDRVEGWQDDWFLSTIFWLCLLVTFALIGFLINYLFQ